MFGGANWTLVRSVPSKKMAVSAGAPRQPDAMTARYLEPWLPVTPRSVATKQSPSPKIHHCIYAAEHPVDWF